MKKEIEKRNELIGLEEINQAETSEVNGGWIIVIIASICCHDIPPRDSTPDDRFPWDKW